MLYFDYLTEIIGNYPDRPAFIADTGSITFSQLDLESARVYRYLKEQGIGADQIVQILMPKNEHFFSCMLGVWKAGAAFVLVQDNYPPERIEFIRKETESVLVLDQGLFERIMKDTQPLPGWEERDLHQMAYIVYTSGSTGTPKGIIHEYGNLERCVLSVPANRKRGFPPEKPLMGPLSFVHTILNLVYNTMDGITTLLEPEEKLRDFNEFQKYILEKQLPSIYLPPSYIRIYTNPSPYLKLIGTGSEPANGLYYPGGIPAIINTYSCSEAGFAVMNFRLDHAYDVAPIGRPLPGVEAVLMDDEDQIIEGPGQGELCFKNDYFRGYLGHPELTEKAKRGGYYHTSDICRRDEDGLYYIVGRADDMVKINGNRIEPSEIEAAVQKCTGLSKVVAKGFVEEDRSYVAVYYLKKEAETLKIYKDGTLLFDRDALNQVLPRYMIPACYIPLEEFPLNASGKISRKDLQAPDQGERQREYIAPRNAAEKYLCEKIALTLGRQQVGITDDFFEIGGDSMRCIRLVSICGELEISAADIFRYRTAGELALRCPVRKTAEELEAEEREARIRVHALLPEQVENYYCQSYAPESGFLNQYFYWKMHAHVTPERLAGAVNKAILAHPGLCIRIFRDGSGQLLQRYEPSFYQEISVEDLTEDRLLQMKEELRSPFSMENAPLYRCRIFRTKSALYFYCAVHHILTDGAAMRLLGGDILRCLAEEHYQIEKDYYFAVLDRRLSGKRQTSFLEAESYFRDRLNKCRQAGTPLGLKKDRASDNREADLIRMQRQFDRRKNRDSNFYLTACALAEAWYNGCDYALISTIYACRDNHESMTAFGLLLHSMAICLDASDGTKPQEMLKSMEEQTQKAIVHTEYSYIGQEIGDSSDMIRFIYQKDVYRKPKPNPLIKENLDLVDRSVMPGSVSISVIDNTGEDQLRISVRYAKSNYDIESIERYLALIGEAVDFLEREA